PYETSWWEPVAQICGPNAFLRDGAPWGKKTPRSRMGSGCFGLDESSCLFPVANIDEMAGDRGCRGHGRRHQMGAALETLTAFEIAVRSRSAAFVRLQPIIVHGQAHGAARLAPVEAGGDEDLVEAF